MEKVAATSEKSMIPEFCLTFSPNWYLPQILSISEEGLLAYGANADVYVIDLLKRSFVTSVRCILKSGNENKSKVTAVLSRMHLLFAGFADGTLCIWNEKLNYEFIKSASFPGKEILNIAEGPKFKENIDLYLGFRGGEVVRYSLETQNVCKEPEGDPLFLRTVTIEDKQVLLAVFSSGTVLIFSDSNNLLFKWESKAKLFNAAEPLTAKNCITLLLLTKKNVAILLQINAKTAEGSLQFEITKEYRKNFAFEKNVKHKDDPEYLKAQPNIHFLNPSNVLISGKAGELFIIPMSYIEAKEDKTIALKHSALHLDDEDEEEEQKQPSDYSVVEENTHYKQVYLIANVKLPQQDYTTVLTLGIDRQLLFWRMNQPKESKVDLIPSWTMNFIGGRITNFAVSPTEKHKIILACYDKKFRVWNLEKKNNRFHCQDLWKQVPQSLVVGLKFHPTEEEIVTYFTDDCKIGIYSIFSQSCFKVVQLTSKIQQLLWVRKSSIAIIKALKQIAVAPKQTEEKPTTIPMEEEVKEDPKNNPNSKPLTGKKLKSMKEFAFLKTGDAHFSKTISDEYLPVVLLENKNLFIWDFHKNSGEIISAPLLSELNVFECYDFENPIFLLGLGMTSGDITLLAGDTSSSEISGVYKGKHVNQGVSSLKFKKAEQNDTVLCACGSLDRRIVIYQVHVDQSTLKIKAQVKFIFKNKLRVLQVKWAELDYKLLSIAERDKTLQLWDCAAYNTREEMKSSEHVSDGFEVCNIRGHYGYVTEAEFSKMNPNFVITASDDQTIKVWDITKSQFKSQANKKKKKNKRKKPANVNKAPTSDTTSEQQVNQESGDEQEEGEIMETEDQP